jgi:hypothetical protein
MKFDAGLREELLFLEAPQEHFVPAAQQPGAPPAPPGPPAAGVMLTSGAVLESVYDGVRVVHRGTLRVTFSLSLKVRA